MRIVAHTFTGGLWRGGSYSGDSRMEHAGLIASAACDMIEPQVLSESLWEPLSIAEAISHPCRARGSRGLPAELTHLDAARHGELVAPRSALHLKPTAIVEVTRASNV